MEKCRIACVRYLNTVPLIEGLEKVEGVELIPTVPSRIAGMVRSGEAEVGLCSVVDASDAATQGRSDAAGHLVMLPVGMIGCDGATLTVRVFSRVPMEKVREVHADTDSHTSVVLCRVVLTRLFGVDARVVDFDARERVAVGGNRERVRGGNRERGTGNRRGEEDEDSVAAVGGGEDLDEAWPETVLLIGDKVVTDAPPEARYPYQLDLGEAWKKLTGLPFVYAVWMCRGDRVGEAAVVAAAAALDRQRRHNAMRLDWIVAKHAPEHRWPVELARKYLGEYLKFDVGEREREAVGRFFSEAGLGEAEWVEAGSLQRQGQEAGVGGRVKAE